MYIIQLVYIGELVKQEGKYTHTEQKESQVQYCMYVCMTELPSSLV